MNEAVQLSGLDQASPYEKRAAAGGRGMEKKRVAMAPITPEMMQLSLTEQSLEKDIEDLQTKLEGRSDDVASKELRDKLVAKKENRRAILDRLVELAPEEFKLKAQFEQMQDKDMEQRGAKSAKEALIEVMADEREELEDAREKLKGKLTLAKAEHKEALGIDPARSSELEEQIPLMEAELEQTNKQILQDLKTLSELDPKRFKKDAEEEIAFAAMASQGLKETNEAEIDDLIAHLHEGINDRA